MKSIWEKIKLAFGRKPIGDILLPPKELNAKVNVEVIVPQKPKRVRKKASNVVNESKV
jgi:hypothetical protein